MSLLKNVNLLLGYKAWANKLTFSALEGLPDAELYKVRKTNFKSMTYTLNHVYVIDDIFKAHLSGKPHGYTSRNTNKCPTLEELWSKQKIIDIWYLEYVSNLSEDDLDRSIHFKYVGAGHGDMTVNQIILHITNHGSYHRGFVSDMMYQIPATVPTNDLTVYIRDIYKNT